MYGAVQKYTEGWDPPCRLIVIYTHPSLYYTAYTRTNNNKGSTPSSCITFPKSLAGDGLQMREGEGEKDEIKENMVG